MRIVVRVVASLVFLIAQAWAITGTWLAHELVDKDGFVESTMKLTENAEVRHQLIDLVSTKVSTQPRVPLDQRDLAAAASTRILERAVSSDRFEKAWRESMARTHELQFGEHPPARITIELAPFVDLAITESEFLSGLGLQPPPSVTVSWQATDIEANFALATRIASLRWVAAAAAIGSGLLLVFSARPHHRAGMVALIGGLTTAATVMLAVGFRVYYGSASLRQAIGDKQLTALAEAISASTVDSIDQFLVPLGVIGLATAALGVLWRAISRRQF